MIKKYFFILLFILKKLFILIKYIRCLFILVPFLSTIDNDLISSLIVREEDPDINNPKKDDLKIEHSTEKFKFFCKKVIFIVIIYYIMTNVPDFDINNVEYLKNILAVNQKELGSLFDNLDKDLEKSLAEINKEIKEKS